MGIPSSDSYPDPSQENLGKVLVDGGIELVKKILASIATRKYAFIGERKTIDITRDQKRSKEIKIYKEYVNDPSRIILFEMGITLRKLESMGDYSRIETLKNKIKSRYDICGVKISQAIQNRILSRYITELIEEGYDKEFISARAFKFLEDIDGHVFFIQNERRGIDDLLGKISLKIMVKSPEFFAISGKGPIATLVIEQISDALKNSFGGEYSISRHFNEKDAMIFMKRD